MSGFLPVIGWAETSAALWEDNVTEAMLVGGERQSSDWGSVGSGVQGLRRFFVRSDDTAWTVKVSCYIDTRKLRLESGDNHGFRSGIWETVWWREGWWR